VCSSDLCVVIILITMLCFSLNGFGSFEFGDYSMSNNIDLFSIVTNL